MMARIAVVGFLLVAAVVAGAICALIGLAIEALVHAMTGSTEYVGIWIGAFFGVVSAVTGVWNGYLTFRRKEERQLYG